LGEEQKTTMSRLGEEQKTTMSRLGEEQKTTMSRLGEEQKTAMSRLGEEQKMTMSRIDEMLDAARQRLVRMQAQHVPEAVGRGAVLVDIRPQAQRDREGSVPGALVIERNVLEWRCDSTSDARLPQAVDDDVEWVVFCSQGYTSSLAAAALQDLGLRRATDVVGGYWALAETGALAEIR
jgi:rhodanese-related sulfurtransferase